MFVSKPPFPARGLEARPEAADWIPPKFLID